MTKQLEYLCLQIGFNTTNAFGFIKKANDCLEAVAYGEAKTTLKERNVGKGVFDAIEKLEQNSNYGTDNCQVFGNTSVVSKLNLCIHGLDKELTDNFTQELLKTSDSQVLKITYGNLSEFDIDSIEESNPDLILFLSGKKFRDKETILSNALKLSAMDIGCPVIYIGNSALSRGVENIFKRTGIEVSTITNAFLDENKFDFSLIRKSISEFLKRLSLKVPGMEKIKLVTNYDVLSRHEAFSKVIELFKETKKDLNSIEKISDYLKCDLSLLSALGTIYIEYPELVKNTFLNWSQTNDKLFTIQKDL